MNCILVYDALLQNRKSWVFTFFPVYVQTKIIPVVLDETVRKNFN